MASVTLNSFHNVEIVNLEYLGNNNWIETWGTSGGFGAWQGHYYHFGVRVKYLIPLDEQNTNHHLVLTLPFTFGNYDGDYLIYALDEVNNIHTLKATKSVSNSCFVIDLLHESHYENGSFVFYIATPEMTNQFCMVSSNNTSLSIDYSNDYQKINHNYGNGITDNIISLSSNYGERFTNAYGKASHNIDIYYPNVFNPNASYPVVVTLHGRNWSTIADTNSVPDYTRRSEYQNNITFFTREKNAIVVSIEYRLLVFPNIYATCSWHSNCPDYDPELYANNYLDMMVDVGRAISYIKSFMPYVNQNKIHLMGYSSGGHIALLYAHSASQQIQSSLVHSIAGVIVEAAPYEVSSQYQNDDNVTNLLFNVNNLEMAILQ